MYVSASADGLTLESTMRDSVNNNTKVEGSMPERNFYVNVRLYE